MRPNVTFTGSSDAPDLAELLQTMLLEETLDGAYRCELTFRLAEPDTGYLVDKASAAPQFGQELRVTMGSEATPLFEGRVMGLEAQYPRVGLPQLTVLADDRLQDFRMTRRTRTLQAGSAFAALKAVATSHTGLSFQAMGALAAAEGEGDGGQGDSLTWVQLNQSDLAFMRERAREIDAELWVVGTTLYAATRSDRGTNSVALQYQPGGLGTLSEFQVLADLAGQRTGWFITGWDVRQKQGFSASATDIAAAEVDEGATSGPSLLSKLCQDSAGLEQIVHMSPNNVDEAKAVAQALCNQSARQFVTARGMAAGTPGIRVGTFLQIAGVGDRFSGKYYVTEARHLFDPDRGYRTQFRAERAGIGGTQA